MKSFTVSRGWLFPLKGGPNAGTELRLGWLTPNKQRQRMGEEVWMPSGAVYVARVQTLKDGTPVQIKNEKERAHWNAVRPQGIPEGVKVQYVYDPDRKQQTDE